MHYKLIRSRTAVVDTGRTSNVGYDYDRVIAALARLDAEVNSHEEIDTDTLSDEELQKLIGEVQLAFGFRGRSRKGRKVASGVYGSRSDPWPDFGRGVPSLVVYNKGSCIDAYPHEETAGRFTIARYLALE